jgi:hypothetical protein
MASYWRRIVKTVDIEVCERLGDRTNDNQPKYHAQVKDYPELWACGITYDDAIGNLI